MSKANLIHEFLAQLGINALGSPVSDDDSSKKYLVHVEITRDSDNRQVPSNKILIAAKNLLNQQHSIDIDFLLNNTQHKDIEAGLRANLLHSYGRDIRNAFLSIDESNAAHVWLDAKQVLDTEIISSIRKKCADYFLSFDIGLSSLDTLDSAISVPSASVCLKVIRELAPVDLATLKIELEQRDFVIPSIDWLSRRLDTLRKSSKVIWLPGGRYALPMTTLRSLGTLKNRDSPDIKRFLKLARRTV